MSKTFNLTKGVLCTRQASEHLFSEQLRGTNSDDYCTLFLVTHDEG